MNSRCSGTRASASATVNPIREMRKAIDRRGSSNFRQADAKPGLACVMPNSCSTFNASAFRSNLSSAGAITVRNRITPA